MAVLKGGVKFFSNFKCLCKYKVTSKDCYFPVFVISTHQCDSVKKFSLLGWFLFEIFELKNCVKFHGGHFGANLVSKPPN